jgi:hypothetical protein
MTTEKEARMFANHLAFSIRKQRDGSFVLVEYYKEIATQRRLRSPHRTKLKLGRFRSYAAVERALIKFCEVEGKAS